MVIKELKPNHVCCNPNCTKGEDGGRKKYYACDYCDRIRTWISLCCSAECFAEYAKSKTVAAPQRIDKTAEEVAQIVASPIEEVKEDALQELADAGYSVDEDTLADVIEEVNKDIDKRRKKTTK